MSTAGARRVVIERATESDGAEVFVISDEESEFARASRISDALHYASDLLYGPGTGPRGTVWNLLSAMEEPDWGQPSGTAADRLSGGLFRSTGLSEHEGDDHGQGEGVGE